MAEIAIIGATLGAGLELFGNVVQSFMPTVRIEGPRSANDRINASSYGQPIPLIFGEHNRISGNLIWASGLYESKKTRSSGGKGGGGKTKTTTYTYSRSFAFAIGENIANLSRIWANGKLLFEQNDITTIPDAGYTFSGGNGRPYSSIRVYPGSATQNPCPVIEAFLGAGNASGYRYCAYVTIENLQLADFGNSTPNFEFEVSGGTATTRSIVTEICQRSGMASDEYAIDNNLTDTVSGFVISQQADAISATEPLRKAFAFDASEEGGTIRFTKRGINIAASLELSDMGARARSDGQAGEWPLTTTLQPEYKMPRSATVTYISLARDYQDETQTSMRNEGGAETKLNVSLPITMSSSLARKVVDRLLWEPWTSRMSARFSLTDKFQFLRPAHVVAIPIAGERVPYRIESRTRGADGIINIEAVRDDPFVYDGSTDSEEAEIPSNDEIVAGETFALALNLPIIDPSESASSFNYVIDAAGEGWRGGVIMRSTDGGTTFSTMGESGQRNITGTVATATPAVATADVWDRSTVIEVELLYDGHELESVTELEVLNGKNACWIGAADGSRGEIIQFATATLISSSPRIYQLSDLLRGRRATEHEISLHTSNEIFVFFESGLIQSADFTVSDWDREREYKGVSVLQDETDVVTSQSFINTGEKARPRSPVHGRGSRDGSGDVVISWMRRTRHFAPGIGYGAVALDEQAEAYEIDVYDGPDVVRTITSATTSVTYTAAQQTADGLTPGDPVSVRIYQISSTRGRGHAGVFTV